MTLPVSDAQFSMEYAALVSNGDILDAQMLRKNDKGISRFFCPEKAWKNQESTYLDMVLFVWAKQKDPKCGTKTDAKNAE